ncbi:hypothetical protein GH714_008513 [Hevea brasiliensis]|uniref:Aspartic peptidase DDI1-type domain-containing protein n=1 Tax=Hevea brasiliensis TaxID=3981 RepID=A0A6A6LMZ3_HEVBR|nr:hypothetical protein GH714_008513 [Hevea brasiliensis]
MEIERRGARDLATAIFIAESLVEIQRSERSKLSPQKDRNEGGNSQGKDGSSKSYKLKEGHPRSQRDRALVEEREETPFQPREATMGSLQLSALKVQEKGTSSVEKGRPFVQIKVEGEELRALLDTGASHNFLTVEEAKRLGIPYEKEMGWLKAVNSTPNLIHGVAREVKVHIGDWHGTLDFFIVSIDDSQCILGVEFVDRAKAIPMIFANSMCITGEVVHVWCRCCEGRRPTPLQPCMLRCMILHQLFRERSSLGKEEVLRRRIRRSVRGDTL